MSTNRISLLPQDVVDRIAAGEVVVRPINAVKELIENSLDAGSTEIIVTIAKGGLELIKVQDNGCGIDSGDMPIVCARFATSKLKDYEDLRHMSTFGFRGEALASISYVANVTIISRCDTDKCAHKAKYQDGKMVDTLTYSAGLKGTIISAENLFYNCLSRKNALKYPHDEANRIIDLLVKYAINYPNVSFAFRRMDASSSDFRTMGKGDQKSTIQSLLGARITKELMNIDYDDANDFHFSFCACFTAPIVSHTSTAIQSRQDRHKYFHLFINGRCVESPRLKQSIDLVFSSKDTTCQFITISLQIDPERVDVNVHPTKAVVHFLDEEKIFQIIEREMFKLVNDYCTNGIIELTNAHCPTRASASLIITKKGDDSVNYKTETSNTSTNESNNSNNKNNNNSNIISNTPLIKRPRLSDFEATPSRTKQNDSTINKDTTTITTTPNSAQRIRIDANNRTLDEFVQRIKMNVSENSPATILRSDTQLVSVQTSSSVTETPSQIVKSLARNFELDSLKALRKAVCNECDINLLELFRKHYFVGFYDNCFGIFQVESNAYIVQLDAVIKKFFYQLVIFSFGNMGSYRLQIIQNNSDNSSCNNKVKNSVELEMLRIDELLALYYEANNIEKENWKTEQLMENLANLSSLLWDYFSVDIVADDDDNDKEMEMNGDTDKCRTILYLRSLPCVLDGYVPSLESIPELIYSLGKVNCTDEQVCFKEIAEALANFFSPNLSDFNNLNSTSEFVDDLESEQMSLRRFVFPILKSKFLPPKHLNDYVQNITSIEQAFKKFGRC